MKKKIVILMFLFLGLFLYPVVGHTDEGGKFGLGIRGGWYKAEDADEGKLYGGLQVRWKVFPALAIEGLVDYHPEQTFPDNKKITSYPVLVSALFYLIPGAPVSPYLLGGVGWYYSKVEDNSGTNWTNDFGAHLGGGLDIPLSPQVVFNADLRYYFLNFSDQKVKDLKTNGYIISAGFTFYLW
ncbi:MAG: outer membrane beta-barrel protein [Deltaproteobacteria bacterium]|nr:outer membrane beta-barrel protein [Deltaproteobacteria bacterium]